MATLLGEGQNRVEGSDAAAEWKRVAVKSVGVEVRRQRYSILATSMSHPIPLLLSSPAFNCGIQLSPGLLWRVRGRERRISIALRDIAHLCAVLRLCSALESYPERAASSSASFSTLHALHSPLRSSLTVRRRCDVCTESVHPLWTRVRPKAARTCRALSELTSHLNSFLWVIVLLEFCLSIFSLPLPLSSEVLIEKQWQSRLKRAVCEIFWDETAKITNRTEVPPIVSTSKYFFLSTYRFGLTFLSVFTSETPPVFIMEFQHLLGDIVAEYCGGDSVNEQSIRENFSILLQLLDEMVDGGFPLTTELTQLKDMILPPSLARRLFANVLSSESAGYSAAVSQDLPTHAVSKIPWRRADVKYVTNEIYFDMVESIDAILSPDNNVLHANIFGDINCNCRLSGMPDLTLSFSQYILCRVRTTADPLLALTAQAIGQQRPSVHSRGRKKGFFVFYYCSVEMQLLTSLSVLFVSVHVFSQTYPVGRRVPAPLRAYQPLHAREGDLIRARRWPVQTHVLSHWWPDPDADLCQAHRHIPGHAGEGARAGGHQVQWGQACDQRVDIHPTAVCDARRLPACECGICTGGLSDTAGTLGHWQATEGCYSHSGGHFLPAC
jgi:hypothetical protein